MAKVNPLTTIRIKTDTDTTEHTIPEQLAPRREQSIKGVRYEAVSVDSDGVWVYSAKMQ